LPVKKLYALYISVRMLHSSTPMKLMNHSGDTMVGMVKASTDRDKWQVGNFMGLFSCMYGGVKAKQRNRSQFLNASELT
jgi:hypothetical protein